jgi:hypothetical protein
LIFSFIFAIKPIYANTQPQTLGQIQEQEASEALQNQETKSLEEFGNIIDKRKSDCLKALGNDKFCDCLNDKLPIMASFLFYVETVISSKGEINDAIRQTPDLAKVIDKIISVRNECVRLNNH